MPSAFLRSASLRLSLTCFVALASFSTIARAQVPLSTTTSLQILNGSSTVTTVPSGTAITLKAAVTVMSTKPISSVGVVEFCNAAAPHCTDINLIGSMPINPNTNAATLKFVPGPGQHAYKAIFIGAPNAVHNLSPSSSTVASVTVTAASNTTPAASTVSLSSSGSPTNYNLSATVTGTGTSPFTGSVSFLDSSNNSYSLGTSSLSLGSKSAHFSLAATENTNTAVAIAVGDFNGDGINDLAFPGIAGYSLIILLGKGDGTFTTLNGPETGLVPVAIAIGDFNADGIQDLAVANSQPNTVSILLGKGDGTFTTLASPKTGSSPDSIAVGDFDGDGILDLAVANSGGSTLTILKGKGDGTFTTLASPQTGSAPYCIAVGDFDGDGILDLAVANRSASTVTILKGKGDGTFTTLASPATGSSPRWVVAADFNGDGILDLATANAVDNTLTILQGKGDGTFNPLASPATDSGPISIDVGDFNADGIADLAVANEDTDTLTMLQGNGDGTFTPVPSLTTGRGPNQIVMADLNGDGVDDLVNASVDVGTSTIYLNTPTLTATASLNGVSPIGPGVQHTIVASYSGDSNYQSAISSPTALSTSPEATSLVLNATPTSTANYGEQVTLTATLSPYTAQGHSTDGQPVNFYNGTNVIGTANLSAGQAVLNLTNLPTSTDLLSANYPSTTNFAGATSTVVHYTVTNSLQPLTVTAANITLQAGATQTTTVGQLLSSYDTYALTPAQVQAAFANAELGFTISGQGITYTIPLYSYGAYLGNNLLPAVPATAPLGTYTATPYLTGPGAANFTLTAIPGSITLTNLQPLTVTAANITLQAGATQTTTVGQLLSSYDTYALTPAQVQAAFANAELGFTISGQGITYTIPLYSYGAYLGNNLLPAVPATAPLGTYTATPYLTGPGAANFTLTAIPGSITLTNSIP